MYRIGVTLPALYAFLVLVTACGDTATSLPEDDRSLNSDISWIADTLPELHYDLFMYESEDSLRSRLNSLEVNLDNLDDMQAVMELTRILATMRCSHTGIAFWDFGDWSAYPISVMWLEEGLYVTGIDAEYPELIGSKLIRYGGAPALEAAAAMSEMFPATNDVVLRTGSEAFLSLGHCMEALGYGDTVSPVPFTFVKSSDDTVTVEFSALDRSRINMIDFHFSESVSIPLFLESDDFYWYRYLPEEQMLYCAYNTCALMDGYDINAYVNDLRELIRSEQVYDVVLDLRRNSGGNSMVAAPLVSWVREQAATGTVRLSLIIGRWTYSSGILNALELSEIPGVTVYGGITGGAPNHLGEVRIAELPWTGLRVSYPTKYFQRVDGEGSTMAPDIHIPLSPAMLFQGENSILDAISESSPIDMTSRGD